MFDQLWEESPMIQKMREQYRIQGLQEGRQKGLQEGEILALQKMLVTLIRAHYPTLADLAQQRATHFNKPDTLEHLIQNVVTAPNVDAARHLLESGADL
jgi:flagellar biosynthesis/type III secretory pathway protein FliH